MTDIAAGTDRPGLSAEWLRRRLSRAADRGGSAVTVRHDAENRFEPFPLTDMQQAYWLGRSSDLAGGGTMQMYQEFTGALLDVDRLERAWNRLIDRHDMLRAVATADGRQRVLKVVPQQHIERIDLSDRSAAERDATLEAMRERMLGETPPLDAWPQSRLAYAVLERGGATGGGCGRLFMRLDMWCFDGRSFQIVIEDLATLYTAENAVLPRTAVEFRDYVTALQAFEQSAEFERALTWWRDRLATLPPPPSLPYEQALPAEGRARFRRVDMTLTSEQTAALKTAAQGHGLGLPAVMATVYAQTLSRWSGQTHFTLNVPRFNRPDWHGDLNDVVGEFASFSLLEVELSASWRFCDTARQLQEQLWTDLGHSAVSGVRLLRELARHRGTMETAAMPVVFTTMPERRSTEAAALEQAIGAFGTITYSLTGTPQVWLDNQYFELGGALHCNWDAVDGLFPDGVLDDMFGHYRGLLTALATDPEAWQRVETPDLPDRQLAVRRQVNNRPWAMPAGSLLAEMAAHAHRNPAAFAIADGDRIISRGELSRAVGAVARRLRDHGVRPGDVVAVYAPRGWRLIAAALGIFAAGAVYMPLDVDSPPARRAAMIDNARPKLILSGFEGHLTDGTPVPTVDLTSVIETARADDALPGLCPDDKALAAIIHTSGSTGTPKGVMVPWSALSHVVRYTNQRFGLAENDRAVMATSCHHDLSLYDLLGPLAAGGGLITLDPAQALDPAHWLARAVAGGATFWNSVPRLAEALVDHIEQHPDRPTPPMRRFVLGGDFVPSDLPARLFARWPNLAVTTIGGPTETTIWNIMHDVPRTYEVGARIPYGTPIPGCAYRILDAAGRDCPDWVVGEMACGGASLTDGYINMPTETAQRYVRAADTGERLYLTGDRGRYRPDGSIEILGRMDAQLNVGGYRTEPAEVEAAIERHPQIKTAVVVAQQNGAGPQLCAFVTLADGTVLDEAALRAHCADLLPPALVPKIWHSLDQLPLTGNGKVDRKALQSLPVAPAQTAVGGQGPSTPLEQFLATLWAATLDTAVTDIDRNFFADGGDSIGATRMLNRIEQDIGPRLSIGAFFAGPTIRGLATEVLRLIATQVANSPPQLASLTIEDLARLARTSGADAERFPTADRDDLVLSWAQERLWFLDRLEPGKAIYIMPFCTAIQGPLSVDGLQRAVHDVARRHEPLRMVFPAVDAADGGAQLRILEDPQVPFRYEDLSAVAEPAQAAAWTTMVRTESARPFDLTTEPPFRVCLAKLGPDRHALCCTFHHIAFDGWSIGLFNRDLFAAYERRIKGEMPNWSPVASYADYALWQKTRLDETALAGEADWWRERLAAFAPLSPSGDFLPSSERAYAGANVTFALPKAVMTAVEALARQTDATANIVLLAAFAAAIGRFEQQSRFVIGASTAGRDHPATEAMIGFFIKNLPVRADLQDRIGFRQFVGRMKDEFIEGLDHLDIPFQHLVAALAPDRKPNRNPLYQVAFTFENAPRERAAVAGLDLTDLPAEPAASHLDLDVLVWPTAEGAVCNAIYSADIFRRETVEQLCAAFRAFLEAGLANPETAIQSLPLADAGIAKKAAHLAGPSELGGVETVWGLVEGGLRGLSSALEGEAGGTLASGPALLERAAALDARLGAAGVVDGQPVAVLLDPGVDYAAAVLACLRRASPYALLDPLLPAAAVAERLAAAGLTALIAPPDRLDALAEARGPAGVAGRDNRFVGLAPDAPADAPAGDHPPPPPRPAADPDQPLLMVWTSGSTGSPKTPVLTQRGLRNRLLWDRTAFPREPRPRALLKTSPAFVDSVAELLQPFVDGFPAVVPDPDDARAPSALLRLLHTAGPTRLVLTPSLLRALLDAADDAEGAAEHDRDTDDAPTGTPWPLYRLHLSGEPLAADLLPRLRPRLRPDAVVLNLYGAAEVTADVTAETLDLNPGDLRPGAHRLAIGTPLPGCQVWLLDPDRRPVPPGAVGEMHIAGAALAAGYHRAPALTDRAFFPWTDPDGRPLRLYATGDLARLTDDHRLLPLGRKDAQIKRHGVRIEPAEIEARLLDLPDIRAALVTTVPRQSDDRHTQAPALVAYLEPASTAPDDDARQDHWRRVYDQSYQTLADDAGTARHILDDFRIWRSAVDGAAIPADHMRAWVDHICSLVRERPADRLVEVGCGQGLLLGRLAPEHPIYLGTDISDQALACVDRLRQADTALAHVRTLRQPADRPIPHPLIPDGGFDVALLSSVVQYFPGPDYLLRTLCALLPAMATGGRLILADLRGRHLAPLLAADILRHRADDALDPAALRRRRDQLLAQEPELLVDPRYFAALGRRLPRLAAVDARPRPGPQLNELTRYRYDIVLHLDHPPAADTPATPATAWAGRNALNAALARKPAALRVRAIPQQRLAGAARAHALLDDPDLQDAADWRRRIDQDQNPPTGDPDRAGLDPAELTALAEAAGYRALVRLDLNGDPGQLDLLCRPADRTSPDPAALAVTPTDRDPHPDWIANPYDAAAAGDLTQRAKHHLRLTLPPAFIPDHLITVQHWPKSNSQKILTHKLPKPDAIDSVNVKPPATDTERVVAAIWTELLDGQRDVEASFFEVGGNSLLLAEVHQRLVQRIGHRFPLIELFRHPTIRSQAAYLDGDQATVAKAAEAGRRRAERRRRARPKVHQ